MPRTFYEVLEVPRDASQEAIRDAYQRKVKEHHPDVSDDPDATDRFKRIVRAEEVLGDPGERRKYDRLGHDTYLRRYEDGEGAGPASSPWTPGESSGERGETGGFDPREAAASARTGDDGSGGGTTAQRGATGGSRASASQGFGPAADRQHATGRADGRTGDGFGSSVDPGNEPDGGGTDPWEYRSTADGSTGYSADPGYSVRDWDDDADVVADPVPVRRNHKLLAGVAAGALGYTLLLVLLMGSPIPLIMSFLALVLVALGGCFLVMIRILS